MQKSDPHVLPSTDTRYGPAGQKNDVTRDANAIHLQGQPEDRSPPVPYIAPPRPQTG